MQKRVKSTLLEHKPKKTLSTGEQRIRFNLALPREAYDFLNQQAKMRNQSKTYVLYDWIMSEKKRVDLPR